MSRMKKILVAYDGSPQSKQALNWAIDLSLLSEARVAAVKVFEGSQFLIASDTTAHKVVETLERLRREDQELLDEAAAIGKSRGVTVVCESLHGNIAEQIICYAREHGFDMIVVGTKGHGVLEELLMGSVTRNLISLAHIPVLVVKD